MSNVYLRPSSDAVRIFLSDSGKDGTYDRTSVSYVLDAPTDLVFAIHYAVYLRNAVIHPI